MPLTINGSGSLTPSGSSIVSYPGGVLQVVSTNFTTQLSYGSGDGSGQSLGNSTFSVIPSATYVNITSKLANSKFLIIGDGNLSASNDSALADWIGAYGIVVDPAGGTSWTRIGSGLQGGSSNPNNKKFFVSRASPNTSGNDAYYVMPMSINHMYSSSVGAGVTLRFAIEYFHYYGATHTTLYINRTPQNDTTNAYSYTGGLATTITVMELAS
jgi:hypothetical protein